MDFNMKEIIDIAVGIEETGYKFYSGYKDVTKDPAVIDVFGFLANEERLHKIMFESMKNNVPEIHGVFTEEYYLYLKAIGGERIFDNREPLYETSPMNALKMALNLEKDSILFYNEMKQLYQEGEEAAVLIDKIISEERKHVTVLSDLAQKIRLT
jgi:rubrerythrin